MKVGAAIRRWWRTGVDPKLLRKTSRDALWILAGAFVAFPLVSAVIIGFDAGDVALLIVAAMLFAAGAFAGRTGIA